VAAQTPINFELKIEESYKAFERGFLEGSNPRAYNRLLTIASVNAVRTMVKPMKNAAPVGKTGRLKASITAKGGRYQKPSATVGPRPGKSRADSRGAWYRYFVTSGHKTRGAAKGVTKGISWSDIGKGVATPAKATGTGSVAARPFVHQVSSNESNLQKAMDTYYATIERFFNDTVFRGTITKFKRKGR
jgi:hypothetical protein